MYQAWPWGGTPSVAPNTTTGGFAPPAVSAASGAQWPAGYSQYAALTPEMQQQWAAAWATQAQYAYGAAVPVAGQASNTAVPYPAPTYTETQPPAVESKNASPSEQPKNSSSEPAPDKLKQLKEQAEQWKTLQQPTTAASWNSAGVSVTAPTVTTSGAALSKDTNTSSSQPNQLDAEEEEFEKQFSDWEKQFDAWKEQNQGHPDKEAFAQYEKQWQEWRATLLLKKEQMQKAKAERAAAATNITPSTTAPAVDVNAGMYYQQQYMYMQPYMYPQGGMVPPPPMQPPYVGGGEMYPPNAPQPENPNVTNTKEMGNFEPGQHGPPPNEYQHYDDYGNMYPPDMEEQRYPNEFPRGGRGGGGRGRGGRWSNANDVDPEMRPGLLDNPGGGRPDFPPEEYSGEFHEGNFGREEFPPGPPPAFRDGDFNSGPPLNRQQGPPPFDYPPDEFGDSNYPAEGDGPTRQRRKFEDRFREGPLPGKTPLLSHDGTTPSLLQREHQGPPPQPSNRYPPDDFDEGPPFPPEGGYGGRPPFPPRGNGRFHPRGRRFPPPHGDFDRFGGPPPPHFQPGDGPPFGPPHDDRFPFPGDRPPRMPMRGGPRGGHFGPRGSFPPEDPFFREGGPPMRFKSKDYTHRTAEDFEPHYEYENDYQEDVMHYRDNFTAELSMSASDPLVFSKVAVETFDYGHGLKPMTSGPADEPLPPVKVFNYAHCGAGTAFHERDPYQEKEPPFPLERSRDLERDYGSRNFRDHGSRDHRDSRNADFKDRDLRDSYFKGRDSDFKGRDFRDSDFKSRDSRDSEFRSRDSRDSDFKGRDSRDSDFKGRDSRDSDFKGRDSRDSDFKGRDSRDSEFKGRDSRDSEIRGRDSREVNFKGRDFRDSDFKGRDSRDGDFKGRDSRDPDSRDSDSKRGSRHREEERPEKRPRWEEERNGLREKSGQKDSFDFKVLKKSEEASLIEDLLSPPQRETRPKQIVVILRGLPGSGKTYVAKLIKDKEIENGGSAPRILSLDDYFMTEVEVNDIDPDTGKKVKRKEFKFEYELEMEETYRSSLFKSFKKTIDDRFFPFIIVDAVHARASHYEHYWSYAKQRGFQVYVAEMDCKDPAICFKRNTHDRSLEDISKILQSWEAKPSHFMALDVRSLLQDVAITEVEMEVEAEIKKEELDPDSGSNDAEDASVPSRWEKLEATEEKLDQLDGLRGGKSKSSIEDYLQLPDDYEERKCEPGKKRVRWADLEERKEQDRLRAIGFVVGQTDWNKMTDPSHADRALTKTKFF